MRIQYWGFVSNSPAAVATLAKDFIANNNIAPENVRGFQYSSSYNGTIILYSIMIETLSNLS